MQEVTDPAILAQLEKSAQPARSYGGPPLPDRIPTTPMVKPPKSYGQPVQGIQTSPEGKREIDPTVPGISRDAANMHGEIMAHGGEPPQMGRLSVRDKEAIHNAFARAAKRDGIDPAEWVIRHSTVKAAATQLTQLHRIYASQGLAKDKAVLNGKMLVGMVKGSVGVGGSNMPVLNAIEQSARYHAGSPGVAEFRSSVKLYATEFARVMTAGGNQLSDSMRHEVDELLRANMSRAQLLRVITRMNTEMDNATEAYHHQIGQISDELRSMFKPRGAKPAAGAPQRRAAGPSMEIRVISRRKVG